MSRPTSVSDGNLGNKGLVYINIGRSNLLAEASNLADFLEEDDFTRFIAIDPKTGRVITTIFLAS